jgi:hypothetical protein
MGQFKTFAPGAEVTGESIFAMTEALGPFRRAGLKILADHGLGEPQPGKWYSYQAYMDALKEISEKFGRKTLESIGLKLPDTAKWPANVDSIEKALASIDGAYRLNVRGDAEGYYRFEKTGARAGKMTCHNPRSCDLDTGLITGTARKFKPADSAMVRVTHDDTQPCRAKGADSCTFVVTW